MVHFFGNIWDVSEIDKRGYQKWIAPKFFKTIIHLFSVQPTAVSLTS